MPKKTPPAHRLELHVLRAAIAELEDLHELLAGLEPSADPSSLARAARLAVDADLREQGFQPQIDRALRELVARSVRVGEVVKLEESAPSHALASLTAWGGA